MGEIADMMLDGTMCCETGEWNFEGEDGPGFPMSYGQAKKYREPAAPFKISKQVRSKLEKLGELRQCSEWHWQVRKGRAVVADWWPHKRKWRITNRNARGDASAFVAAVQAAIRPKPEKEAA